MVQQVSVSLRPGARPSPHEGNSEFVSVDTVHDDGFDLLQPCKQVLTHQGKVEPVPQQRSSSGKTKCQAEDVHSHLRRQAS